MSEVGIQRTEQLWLTHGSVYQVKILNGYQKIKLNWKADLLASDPLKGWEYELNAIKDVGIVEKIFPTVIMYCIGSGFIFALLNTKINCPLASSTTISF